MSGLPVRPRHRGARAPAAALLVALLALGACRRELPPPRVEAVRVAEATLGPAIESGVDAAAVESIARSALAEAGFVVGPDGERAFRARLELSGLRVGPGPRGPWVEARVELELSPVRGDDPARRERGAGSEALGAGGPAPAVRAALATAAGQAARGLRLGLSADGKPVAALVADLESPDIRVREHAVQALGERGDRSAVPALLKRLRDGDAGVVHRTVGALAQLRDPRAVPELIELSRGGDAAVTVRLVRIVGDIGGDDARGWLLTLEQAHADPRVRAAAAEALADAARLAAPGR